jgi:hypothetical protein
MSQITLSPPYAILFIYDPLNKDAETPEYSPGNLVSTTQHCISVGTRADVDGETTVELVRAVNDAAIVPEHKIFQGFVQAPNRNISVVTAELQTILNIDVKDKVAKIGIWADDLHNPGKVLITAE